MSISLLYHTQGVKGFNCLRTKYPNGTVIFEVKQKPKLFKCSNCQSFNVQPYFLKKRKIQALPVGSKKQILAVDIHRLKCHDCDSYKQESLSFADEHKRYSHKLARYVIELRAQMTIAAVANLTGLNWKTVKDIEKYYLEKKYKKVVLKDVTAIGIDEIHLGKWGYKTIVIDLETGAVLHIGQGRSSEALADFSKRLKHSTCQIKTVAVDMAPAYTKWVTENLPEAVIVYDHFHVIKLMNEKLNLVRRNEMRKAKQFDDKSLAEIERYCGRLTVRALNYKISQVKINKRVKEIRDQYEAQAAVLKGTKWLLLGNCERIQTKEAARESLDKLMLANSNIALAYQLKEQLRAIYSQKDLAQAAIDLEAWCQLAEASGLRPIKTMAKTIRSHWSGVLSYWRDGVTSAKVEGFNTKIRWLIKQAYGYHDERYFELKVFDLPNLKLRKAL